MKNKTENTSPLSEFKERLVRWPVDEVTHRHRGRQVKRDVSNSERNALRVLMKELYPDIGGVELAESIPKQVQVIATYAFHCGFHAGQQTQSSKHKELVAALEQVGFVDIED